MNQGKQHSRDFWLCESVTGRQVALPHES